MTAKGDSHKCFGYDKYVPTCHCTVDSYLALVLGILHVCGCTHVRAHVSPGTDCFIQEIQINKVQVWLLCKFLKSTLSHSEK